MASCKNRDFLISIIWINYDQKFCIVTETGWRCYYTQCISQKSIVKTHVFIMGAQLLISCWPVYCLCGGRQLARCCRKLLVLLPHWATKLPHTHTYIYWCVYIYTHDYAHDLLDKSWGIAEKITGGKILIRWPNLVSSNWSWCNAIKHLLIYGWCVCERIWSCTTPLLLWALLCLCWILFLILRIHIVTF